MTQLFEPCTSADDIVDGCQVFIPGGTARAPGEENGMLAGAPGVWTRMSRESVDIYRVNVSQGWSPPSAFRRPVYEAVTEETFEAASMDSDTEYFMIDHEPEHDHEIQGEHDGWTGTWVKYVESFPDPDDRNWLDDGEYLRRPVKLGASIAEENLTKGSSAVTDFKTYIPGQPIPQGTQVFRADISLTLDERSGFYSARQHAVHNGTKGAWVPWNEYVVKIPGVQPSSADVRVPTKPVYAYEPAISYSHVIIEDSGTLGRRLWLKAMGEVTWRLYTDSYIPGRSTDVLLDLNALKNGVTTPILRQATLRTSATKVPEGFLASAVRHSTVDETAKLEDIVRNPPKGTTLYVAGKLTSGKEIKVMTDNNKQPSFLGALAARGGKSVKKMTPAAAAQTAIGIGVEELAKVAETQLSNPQAAAFIRSDLGREILGTLLPLGMAAANDSKLPGTHVYNKIMPHIETTLDLGMGNLQMTVMNHVLPIFAKMVEAFQNIEITASEEEAIPVETLAEGEATKEDAEKEKEETRRQKVKAAAAQKATV